MILLQIFLGSASAVIHAKCKLVLLQRLTGGLQSRQQKVLGKRRDLSYLAKRTLLLRRGCDAGVFLKFTPCLIIRCQMHDPAGRSPRVQEQ